MSISRVEPTRAAAARSVDAVEVEELDVLGLEAVERAACRSHGVSPCGMRRTAGFERPRQCQRLVALVVREVGVARRQRQAVRVADGRHDAQVEIDVQVADHPAEDGSLLGVLLAEVRDAAAARC